MRIVIVAILALCTSPLIAGVLDPLSRNDLRVATRLRDIDAAAVAALKREIDDDDRRLADRGAGFEASDVISEGDFPARRLVIAARAGDTWFVHYEHGGRGYHSHLVALTRGERSWRLTYAAAGPEAYRSLSKLREAIRASHFEKTYDL
jgi:hypothetical protein